MEQLLSLPVAVTLINVLGLPGVIFVIWFFDYNNQQKERHLRSAELAERNEAIAKILAQYREDVSEIRRLYENNVELVRNYDRSFERLERIYAEVTSLVALNARSMSEMTEAMKSNQFCPVMRRAENEGQK